MKLKSWDEEKNKSNLVLVESTPNYQANNSKIFHSNSIHISKCI